MRADRSELSEKRAGELALSGAVKAIAALAVAGKEMLCRRGALRSATARTPAPRLGLLEYTELERLLTRLERRLKDGG